MEDGWGGRSWRKTTEDVEEKTFFHAVHRLNGGLFCFWEILNSGYLMLDTRFWI
jgi:hypothetical protein